MASLNRTKLLKDCANSAAYHLHKNLKALDEIDDIQVDEKRKSPDGGTASKATMEKVRKAQDQVWHAVIRFKWAQGDGEYVAWIKVKQAGDKSPTFRWVKPPKGEFNHFQVVNSPPEKGRLTTPKLHQYL